MPGHRPSPAWLYLLNGMNTCSPGVLLVYPLARYWWSACKQRVKRTLHCTCFPCSVYTHHSYTHTHIHAHTHRHTQTQDRDGLNSYLHSSWHTWRTACRRFKASSFQNDPSHPFCLLEPAARCAPVCVNNIVCVYVYCMPACVCVYVCVCVMCMRIIC